MARFNRHAPYEVVGGLPGAAFIQGGRYFNQGGYEVETYREFEGTENARTMARLKPDASPALTVDEEEEVKHSVDQEIPIQEWHWRKVKFHVEQFGGKWTNRDDGIAFLSNREKEKAVDVDN